MKQAAGFPSDPIPESEQSQHDEIVASMVAWGFIHKRTQVLPLRAGGYHLFIWFRRTGNPVADQVDIWWESGGAPGVIYVDPQGFFGGRKARKRAPKAIASTVAGLGDTIDAIAQACA